MSAENARPSAEKDVHRTDNTKEGSAMDSDTAWGELTDDIREELDLGGDAESITTTVRDYMLSAE